MKTEPVEKIEGRVEELEHNMTQLRIDVAVIKATLPSLAKQEDVATIKAQLPHFATHADVTKLLMWLIGIGLTTSVSIIIGILNYLK